MKELVDQTVDHPSHYKMGKFEVIDILRDCMTEEEFDGFCKGNCIKYLMRAGKKGDVVTDLKKCRWYLDELITEKENRKEN